MMFKCRHILGLLILVTGTLLTVAPLRAESRQCLDLFKTKTHVDTIRDLDDLLHQPEMTYDIVYKSSQYSLVLNAVLEKLNAMGVQYEPLRNGNYIDAIGITPSLKSEFNRMAHDLYQGDGTLVRIPLTENIFASSMGHRYMMELSSPQRLSIYSISLYQFFELGWGGRSRFHRHEMRHRELKAKVLRRINEGKPALITTGSISLMGEKIFPEKSTLSADVLHTDGITRAHEYTFTLPHYRQFISFEEMWTYMRDIQVIARHTSQVLRRAQKTDSHVVEQVMDLMLTLEAAIMINYRLAVVRTWLPTQFYSTTLGKDGQIVFKDNKGFDHSVFERSDQAYYFPDLQLGHMILQDKQGIKALVSLPLEKAGRSDFIQLQTKTNERINLVSQLAKMAAIMYFESYARLHRINPHVFSFEPQIQSQVSKADLDHLANQIDHMLNQISTYSGVIQRINDQ